MFQHTTAHSPQINQDAVYTAVNAAFGIFSLEFMFLIHPQRKKIPGTNWLVIVFELFKKQPPIYKQVDTIIFCQQIPSEKSIHYQTSRALTKFFHSESRSLVPFIPQQCLPSFSK